MTLSTIRKQLAEDWQHVAAYAALLAGAAALLWYKLGTLTGGFGPDERSAAVIAGNWHTILDNPLGAPFTALLWLAGYITDRHLLAARIIAAACGLLALTLFYCLARYWYGERTAVIGSILFGTSAWFLHTARLGTPDVLWFGVLALTACFVWLKRTASGWAVLAGIILTALFLYVPGMVWFIVAGLLWQWRIVDRYFKKNLWAVTAGGVVLLAALTPLGFALYHSPELAKNLAGLPTHGWPMPLDVLRQLGDVPLQLFVRGPSAPQHWLGEVPIIDYFTAAMFFLGGYLYIRHIKLKRFWLVAGIFLLGSALVALGQVSVSVLVPFVYLVAAAGAGFMLDRWFAVFPRNAIAQNTGYCLVGAALLATVAYSYRHYFVAWPAAPETKAVFTIKDTPASVTMKK